MRRERIRLGMWALAALMGAAPAAAQTTIARGRHLSVGAPVKVFVPAGSLRVIGWDRDSVAVRARVARGEELFFAGDARGVKLGLSDHPDGSPVRPCDVEIRVPRGSMVSVKAVSAAIVANDASGWFYSVSGPITLGGRTSSVEVESLSGDVTLGVRGTWVRARTGDGQLAVRGAPEDLDAATVRGSLFIAGAGVMRGRFSSVQGTIRFTGGVPRDAVLDFSNHSGAVVLELAPATSAMLDLSSIEGPIDNGLAAVRPAADTPRPTGATLRLQLGSGASRVTVRTFRGAIRLRAAAGG